MCSQLGMLRQVSWRVSQSAALGALWRDYWLHELCELNLVALCAAVALRIRCKTKVLCFAVCLLARSDSCLQLFDRLSGFQAAVFLEDQIGIVILTNAHRWPLVP